jgi:orotidine-5'-phosphate decarboxylase
VACNKVKNENGMTAKNLYEQIRSKQSFLCIGLDTDIQKIPNHLQQQESPVFQFNKTIIDQTADFAVAYKPNTAFYESRGTEGWHDLQRTVNYIKERYPNVFVIADAKRGDIGNTSEMYARTFFETLPCDAVTLSPYMGSDTVMPFFKHPGKWAVLLALTSNPSATDFQFFGNNQNTTLFIEVIRKASSWGTTDNTMFVVGATKASYLTLVREAAPDHFLLIPGVGAQGGNLENVAKYGMNEQCGLLVNASRSVLYADSSEQFATVARAEAKTLQQQMSKLLHDYNIL